MKSKHLVMITEKNNNKYYDMIPNNDGTFTVKYGRINSTQTVLIKPISQWDKLYNSKIKKGYVDKSMLFEDVVTEINEYVPIKNKKIAKLIDKLQSFATKTINENYDISHNAVTQTMIDEAQGLLNGLTSETTVEGFNKILIKLFYVIPRKMKKVKDQLASNSSQFQTIIDREQALLDTMMTKRTIDIKKNSLNNQNQTILEALNLTIDEKDDALENQVKSMLGEISDKYINCWYVSNDDTQKRYDDHLSQQKGIHKDEQLFWHGSRNENWMSILKNGMLIRPSSAVHTGSMFDKEGGIYFANRAQKSFGYTSAGYWTGGKSKTVYMAIFKVNTGKHHNVYRHDAECYQFTKQYLKNKGNYDSVYAHKGVSLRNDEFIIYDVSQCTIYALVELKG